MIDKSFSNPSILGFCITPNGSKCTMLLLSSMVSACLIFIFCTHKEMSLIIEKSYTVFEAVHSGLVLPTVATVEVIERTPVQGETFELIPNGSKRTMLLLSEIDNTTPFTCSMVVNTANMNLGDQLFVCSKYLIYESNLQNVQLAQIILPSNMLLIACGFKMDIRNQFGTLTFDGAKKQQNVFTFDGEYLISTYDLA